MSEDTMAPAVFITEEYVSFADVLEGKLGPREAGAARFWVDQGSIIEPPAKNSNWISTDAPAGCYDTRVWDPIEEREDAGAATMAAANLGDASGSAPQKIKNKTAAKPRTLAAAGQNMYTKAAFVGHSDTLGTLARRKARSSKNADEIESDKEVAEGAAGAASRAANEAIEKLLPSAALAKLPSGWRVKDLVLDGPRGTKVLDGRLYVSPSGIVCRTYEVAKAMSRAEKIHCRWKYDLKSAISWIKSQATASRAAIKTNVDVVYPRYLVALQRRKAAIKPKSRSGSRMSSFKRNKRKQEGDGGSGGGNESRYDRAFKRQASTLSTPSSGRAGSEKPASGEKKKVESK